MDRFINGRDAQKDILGCHAIEALDQALDEALDQALARPRKVMCMIKAGRPVDAFIESVVPSGSVR
ncbi:MAG: hypothetical protein DSY90_13630 [Deltaproteobacteria bacterium]|nr:MAG: hypothetical protein DSY90_13630 [Deltaproteobacteria bacterium]